MTREHEDACALSGERLQELLRQHARRPLPKRFYKEVEVSAVAAGDGALAGRNGAFAVLLDGRPLRTPLKRPLHLPTLALAEAIAEEWRAQERHIDPGSMPLTGLANVAIDKASAASGANVASGASVASAACGEANAADSEREALLAHLRELAAHDLLCYRADAATQPQLAQWQREHWEPLLQWAESALGAQLQAAQGIMPVAQPEQAVQALVNSYAAQPPFVFAPLFHMATLTRSAILPLALLSGRLDAETAWQAATLEEQWNMQQWGEDAEAAAALQRQRQQFMAAARFLQLISQ